MTADNTTGAETTGAETTGAETISVETLSVDTTADDSTVNAATANNTTAEPVSELHPRPVPTPPAAPRAPLPRSSEFGRVDADGTVYLRTPDGERVIGSWQAGTPEEGLAHFVRRYDDLVTEVTLLEERLASGAAEPGHTQTSVERLRSTLDSAAVIGDVSAIAQRLDALAGVVSAKAEEAKAAKAAARAAALARKQELVAEAEKIAEESTQWKSAGDRMREILDEWKTIKGVDRKADGDLWKRYAAARDAFGRRRGAHFAGLDSERKVAQTRKEELVAEAEKLSQSSEWASTAARLKDLMTEWKAAGRAQRDAEESLWTKFRAAQDAFFTRRSEVFSERDAEYKANQAKKEALLTEAESIDVAADAKAAQAAMRTIQARWEDAGRVPRESMQTLDRRLHAVEEKIREAVDAEWRRSSIESNPILEQMRQQVAEAEGRLERARAAGDTKRVAEAEKALEGKRKFLELAEQSG
jgi:hypothetical protein